MPARHEALIAEVAINGVVGCDSFGISGGSADR